MLPLDERRYRQGAVSAWAGILGNLLLAAFKLSAGVLAHSQAMLADGIHSLADLVGSSAVLVGFGVARHPADSCHPYGHDRAETVAAAVVALTLILAGLNVAYSAVHSLWMGVTAVPGLLALVAAVTSVVLKESLFRYKLAVGRRIDSPAVIANAWEHRSDVLTSLAAAAGILGARMGQPWLDPAAALAVSVFIIRWGWQTARSAVDDLMDRLPEPGTIDKIRAVAGSVAGVEGVGEVRARRMGPNILVDLKIAVHPEISVAAGHRVAHLVRDEVIRGLPKVRDVMVHVDPARGVQRP